MRYVRVNGIRRFRVRLFFDTEEEEQNYKTKYNESYKKYASEIRGGGYTIHTSFDQGIQAQLQTSIDEQLSADAQVQENGKYRLQGAGTMY